MTNLEKMQQFVWRKCESPKIKTWGTIEHDENNRTQILAEQWNITLAHVLNALQDLKEDYLVAFYNNKIYYSHYRMNPALADYFLCDWDLTKNFNEQSVETQQAIAKLLGWKGEV